MLKEKVIKKIFVIIFVLAVVPCFFNAPGIIAAETPGTYSAYSQIKVPFIMPLEGKILVSFRQEYLDEQKQVTRKHTGIDIWGNPGDAVIASANGVVSYCGFSPIGGRTVVIWHNEKIKTTYLNLSQVYVQPGVFVKQGQAIAAIGAWDDPSHTGCHLHFGIIYDGKYLDPEDVLKIDYSSISKYIKLKYIKPGFYVQASK